MVYVQNMKLVEKVRQLADRKGCSLGQLALAWVHHQGDDVFPIPGTKQVKYLEENLAAFDVKLSKQDLAEIDELVPHQQVCLQGHIAMHMPSRAPICYAHDYSCKSTCVQYIQNHASMQKCSVCIIK